MKKKFRYAAYAIFGFSLIFFIFSIAIYFLFAVPLNSYEFVAQASVSSGGIGLDLNGTALTFGAVAPGGTVLRKLSIANNYAFPIKIKVSSKGEIDALLNYPSFIRVEPGEQASIPVTFVAPERFSYGNYSGSVRFLVLRDN